MMPNKQIRPIVLLLLANSLAATLVLPILPLVAVEQFGATIFQALLLETCYYAAKLVAAPILGRASDREGRRPLLLLSQLGTVLAFTWFIVAHPLSKQVGELSLPFMTINSGLLLLYLARILDGITAGSTTVAKAYVADLVAPGERSQALGWLSGTLGIGFIFGPVTGGLLLARFGVLSPFIVAALITAVAFIMGWFYLPESRLSGRKTAVSHTNPTNLTLPQILRQATFVRLTSIGFFATLCFAAISAIFVLYINHVFFAGASDITAASRFAGIAFTIIGITLATTQLFLIKPMVQRFGMLRIIQFSQISMVCTFLLIPLVTNRLLFLLLAIPFVYVYGLLEPNLQALVAQTSGETRGQFFGLYQSTLSGADLLGPVWVAVIFEAISPQAVWWAAGLIMFMGFLISLTFRKQTLQLATSS